MYIAAITGFVLGGLALIGSAFGFAFGRKTRHHATGVPAIENIPAKAA